MWIPTMLREKANYLEKNGIMILLLKFWSV